MDKPLFKTDESTSKTLSHPLRALSAAEFAALGAGSIVYVRQITGADLVNFVPEAAMMPEDGIFQLVMSADGSPVLVTDTRESVLDWLEDKPVTLAQLH